MTGIPLLGTTAGPALLLLLPARWFLPHRFAGSPCSTPVKSLRRTACFVFSMAVSCYSMQVSIGYPVNSIDVDVSEYSCRSKPQLVHVNIAKAHKHVTSERRVATALISFKEAMYATHPRIPPRKCFQTTSSLHCRFRRQAG